MMTSTSAVGSRRSDWRTARWARGSVANGAALVPALASEPDGETQKLCAPAAEAGAAITASTTTSAPKATWGARRFELTVTAVHCRWPEGLGFGASGAPGRFHHPVELAL